MGSTRCFCTATFDGDDDALVVMMKEHLETAHGLAVGPVMVRNAIERQRVLDPQPERLAVIDEVVVTPVSAALVGDFLEFFDTTAFADNVGWASCYCMFHHLDPGTWETRSWQTNRAEMAERLRSGASTGVLAHVDGVVAGWVNAGRRSAYPAHRLGDRRDDETGAIVCFVVGPAYRGHGVGMTLLDAACELLRDVGCTAVEAYPSPDPRSAAAAYRGTAEMYRRAGFVGGDDGIWRRSL
ncbi:MAG: GNAT family N-acetyltransferase [Acidimicrobiia bacterium]|nr:GNAT family N-acetyltransferase [Acidimicrobiia bacterium]